MKAKITVEEGADVNDPNTSWIPNPDADDIQANVSWTSVSSVNISGSRGESSTPVIGSVQRLIANATDADGAATTSALLAVGYSDGSLRLYREMGAGDVCPLALQLKAHSSSPVKVAVLGNTQLCTYSDTDGAFILWDVNVSVGGF